MTVEEIIATCRENGWHSWAPVIEDVLAKKEAAEAALAPFAAYHAWRTTKGIKTAPPALGPAEFEAAHRALAGSSPAAEAEPCSSVLLDELGVFDEIGRGAS